MHPSGPFWPPLAGGVFCAALVMASASTARSDSFVKIDPHGSNETHALSINTEGSIGGYFSNGFKDRAFIRSPDGNYTVYDALDDTEGLGLSDNGYATGATANGQVESFVRDPSGNVTVFNAPNATYTIGLGVNNSGAVAGWYKARGRDIGFVREPDGTIISIQPPDAKITHALGINADGTVVGYFSGRGTIKEHGFLRFADGTLTVFDCPNSFQTIATAINDAGTVTGACQHRFDGLHGFIRDTDGTFTHFRPRGSVSTIPASIASDGSVTGSNAEVAGFARNAAGKIQSFTVNGAQTNAYSINSSGLIVGTYYNTEMRGFLRIP